MRWTPVKTVRLLAALAVGVALIGGGTAASAVGLQINASNQALTSKTGLNNKPCTNNTVAVTASNSTYQITASNIPAACAGQTITVQTYGSTSGASLQQTATISGTSVTFTGASIADAYHVTAAKVLLNGWSSAASWSYTPVCAQYTSITALNASSNTATKSNAVDNNLSTSWIAAATDPQTISIDLGSAQDICQSTLNFGANYGASNSFAVSSNGTTWTSVYSSANSSTTVTLGNGTSKLISTRYLQLTVNSRASTTTGVEVEEWQIWALK